jgi:hypothetical protein
MAKAANKKATAKGKGRRKAKRAAVRVPSVYASDAGLVCFCGLPATCYDRRQQRDVCDKHNTDESAIRYRVKSGQEINEREGLAQSASS